MNYFELQGAAVLSSPVTGGCSVQFTCYRELQCLVHLLQGAAVFSSPVTGGCSVNDLLQGAAVCSPPETRGCIVHL